MKSQLRDSATTTGVGYVFMALVLVYLPVLFSVFVWLQRSRE
jgi:hypothetical protein